MINVYNNTQMKGRKQEPDDAAYILKPSKDRNGSGWRGHSNDDSSEWQSNLFREMKR